MPHGPVALTVRLIVGYGAGMSGSPGQDVLMLQELEDGSWMAGLPTGYLEAGVIWAGIRVPVPGIIQQARLWQVVRPRNVTAETASAFPVGGAQQGAASEYVRAPDTRSESEFMLVTARYRLCFRRVGRPEAGGVGGSVIARLAGLKARRVRCCRPLTALPPGGRSS